MQNSSQIDPPLQTPHYGADFLLYLLLMVANFGWGCSNSSAREDQEKTHKQNAVPLEVNRMVVVSIEQVNACFICLLRVVQNDSMFLTTHKENNSDTFNDATKIIFGSTCSDWKWVTDLGVLKLLSQTKQNTFDIIYIHGTLFYIWPFEVVT